MSDTPETDAEAITASGFEADDVPADFARKLERERDEAREQRNCLHDLHNKNAIRSQELLELCGTLRKELDEAKEELYVLQNERDELLEIFSTTQTQTKKNQ
jgi:hypothetical protein